VPELPEVEALAAFLTERAVGRVVARVDLAALSVLKTYDPPVTSLQGLEVTGVARHGKFLDLDVSGLHLITHLSRAGWLRWSDALSPVPPRMGKGPLAARVHLDDGSGFDLTEAGTQKRLALYVVHSPYDVPGIARLGPDPLSPGFTREDLAAILAGSRQQVKGLLRDQSVLAGVGNAYSDEVLHAARLSPYRLGSSLAEAEVDELWTALQSVLREAVGRAQGLKAAELKQEKKVAMRVHGRTGQPCPVCGDTVREVSFANSSLQYCPTCQTGGKPLADRRLSRLLK
jgi:formamidopyrimidine-DNA glycosylase